MSKKQIIILFVLRVAAIITFTVMSIVRRRKGARYRWLRHYLLGSGKELVLKGWLEDEAHNHITWKWVEESKRNGFAPRMGAMPFSSTEWDGLGFWGRSELFYLVGGLTYKVSHQEDGDFRFFFEDVYDWHPVIEGRDEWYCSPVAAMPASIWSLLKRIDPIISSWFVHGEMPYERVEINTISISNKLWADMLHVGAKEFRTTWSSAVSAEWFYAEMARSQKEAIMKKYSDKMSSFFEYTQSLLAEATADGWSREIASDFSQAVSGLLQFAANPR